MVFLLLNEFQDAISHASDARPGPFGRSDEFDPNISSTGQNYEINKITLYLLFLPYLILHPYADIQSRKRF